MKVPVWAVPSCFDFFGVALMAGVGLDSFDAGHEAGELEMLMLVLLSRLLLLSVLPAFLGERLLLMTAPTFLSELLKVPNVKRLGEGLGDEGAPEKGFLDERLDERLDECLGVETTPNEKASFGERLGVELVEAKPNEKRLGEDLGVGTTPSEKGPFGEGLGEEGATPEEGFLDELLGAVAKPNEKRPLWRGRLGSGTSTFTSSVSSSYTSSSLRFLGMLSTTKLQQITDNTINVHMRCCTMIACE